MPLRGPNTHFCTRHWYRCTRAEKRASTLCSSRMHEHYLEKAHLPEIWVTFCKVQQVVNKAQANATVSDLVGETSDRSR